MEPRSGKEDSSKRVGLEHSGDNEGKGDNLKLRPKVTEARSNKA